MNENVRSTLYGTYKDCTFLGSTHRHRQVQLYNVCTILVCSNRPRKAKRTIYVHLKFSRVEPRKAKCTYIVQLKFSGWQARVQFFFYCIQQSTTYNHRFLRCTISEARVQNIRRQLYAKYNRRKSAFSDCTTSSTFCTGLHTDYSHF